ncbi:MAG: twin-arginine translocation signal domain-containing protein, partial [Deltaproteobacteria bacterium]|nr:twin-arginine translocation signal domain-containing protein [Deltaproteobacteria bacterium]
MQSRRSFLKVGLGGAALLGLSGIGIALQKSRPLPVRAGRTLTFFSATEYAIVAAVAERVLARDVPSGLDPATAGGAIPLVPAVLAAEWAARPQPPAVADVDVAGKMDAFLTPLDPASKKEFKQV